MDSRTFQTLAMSGLAAGVVELIQAGHFVGTGTLEQLGAGIAGIALNVAGGYLTNRASSHRDDALAAGLARQGALLRKAMAEALRKTLAEQRPAFSEIPQWIARLDAWDRNLMQARTSPEKLDLFLPPALVDDLWDASNPHYPSHDEEILALAILLRDWLTTDIRMFEQFSSDDAQSFAQRIISGWRREFAGLVAEDTSGFLFQAFTVDGIYRLRAQIAQLQSETAGAVRCLVDEIRQSIPALPRGLSIPRLHWSPRMPPAAPLRAQYRVVPFHAVRIPELDSLVNWATSKDTFRTRIYAGPGGAGKTRLALEACLSLSARDFAAGFLSRDLSEEDIRQLLRWAANTKTGLFVVVDYAETDQRSVTSLIRHAAETEFIVPIRLVLLARGRGMWWKRLQNAPGGIGDLLADSVVDSVEQMAFALPKEVRAGIFASAADAFQHLLALPRVSVAAPELSGLDYAGFLSIHLAALLAVHGEPIPSSVVIPQRIIDREIAWLERVLNERLGGPYGNCAGIVLKVFTALGGASGREDAISVIGGVPELEGERPVVIAAIADAMHDLYQGEQWIDPLQPDLLAEPAVASIAAEMPALFARIKGGRS